MTPLDPTRIMKSNRSSKIDLPKLSEEEDVPKTSTPAAAMPIPAPAPSVLSPEAIARHSSKFTRRTSAMRKQVAAGDLAMSNMSNNGDNGGAYYRHPAVTPGLPRMDTWRGAVPGSTIDLGRHGGVPYESPKDDDDSFELRDAILISIAKSIGLAQSEPALDPLSRASVAPSVSAVSTPNSPMFPPNTRNAKSPFGNVLDMMNASNHNDNLIGGMLREAVINARHGEDDVSSVSASMHDSMLAGGDVNRSVLRDLEGNVEILFFKQGSTLVKEGERSPGIYYVVDGFLDVSLTLDLRARLS
jgi:lysophospholipid hydrolase